MQKQITQSAWRYWLNGFITFSAGYVIGERGLMNWVHNFSWQNLVLAGALLLLTVFIAMALGYWPFRRQPQ